MWDLETIHKMNKPEEVEKARNKARAMNGVKSGAQSDTLLSAPMPFIYADESSMLLSDHKSDLEYAQRRILGGSGGSIKPISESTNRRPSHGGRVN